jgi:hypothetical protein
MNPLEKQLRELWLIEAFAELAETTPDIAFESFDGDDFATPLNERPTYKA